MDRVEKGLVEHEFVCAIYYLLHCHMKQGSQMSTYPTSYTYREVKGSNPTHRGNGGEKRLLLN
jgi:hypothetical protein